jgi:hypothetical protein
MPGSTNLMLIFYWKEFTMNAISKPDLILGTVEEIKSIMERKRVGQIEPAAPVASTLSARFVAFMDAWTQSSYEAWVKRDKPGLD